MPAIYLYDGRENDDEIHTLRVLLSESQTVIKGKKRSVMHYEDEYKKIATRNTVEAEKTKREGMQEGISSLGDQFCMLMT